MIFHNCYQQIQLHHVYLYFQNRGNDKENVSRDQQMKNSISMGQIQATGNFPDAVPAKMLGGLNNGNKGTIAITCVSFFCRLSTLNN